jgi:hypothetical protein
VHSRLLHWSDATGGPASAGPCIALVFPNPLAQPATMGRDCLSAAWIILFIVVLPCTFLKPCKKNCPVGDIFSGFAVRSFGENLPISARFCESNQPCCEKKIGGFLSKALNLLIKRQ